MAVRVNDLAFGTWDRVLRPKRRSGLLAAMADIDHTAPIALGSGDLRAVISPMGAELLSLQLAGTEWLWQGDKAFWPRRAPVLFPHCGRTRNREIRIGGRTYPDQPIHGFAPTSPFEVSRNTGEELTLTLSDSDETRALYPFAFRLAVHFAIEGPLLHQSIACENTGEEPMPVAAGFHPGFAWPVPGATGKAGHILRFETDEPDPVALPNIDGLMGGATMPSPIAGNVLALTDSVFQAGSAIFTRLRSRSLWFGMPGLPGLAMSFDTPFLVLWRWPGPGEADYLCIEPWAGLPDPAGFAGDLHDKPGVTVLQPGQAAKWVLSLRPGA